QAPPKPTLNSQGLRYTLPLTTPPTAAPNLPSLLLQRLACPYAPFNNNAADPAYNPYITVDYFTNIPVRDASDFTTIVNQPNLNKLAVPARKSVGRLQPYARAK